MIFKRNIIFFLIIGVIISIFCNYTPSDYRVVFTFIFIILFSLFEIFSLKNVSYGTSQVFYLFSLIFLGIAPLFQYLEKVTLWGGPKFDALDYLTTNVLLIIALITYKIIYTNVFKKKYSVSIKRLQNFQKSSKITISTYSVVFISLISTLYIFIIYGASPSALLLRSQYGESDIVQDGGMLYLIHSFFIRPIPAICFLLYKFYHKGNKSAEILLLILMLFTNAPTGMARFAAAAFYIPLALIYFNPLRKRFNFPLIMIVGVVVVFPILNLFRYIGKESATSHNLVIDFSMFLAGHFDSYQMMMRVVSEQYITYGYQLLGVLLFFVPRSIWPSKPIGSGYLIAHEYDYVLENLSMNYFGEGYINFGIIGVIVFSILIGYVNARFDRKYWIESGYKRPLFGLVFFIFVGMEFAILRGALLNIFPCFLGYLTATIVVAKTASIKLFTIELQIGRK